MPEHSFISLAVQAITLMVSILIKNIKVTEIEAFFNKDPVARLEAGGLANAPIMNSE